MNDQLSKPLPSSDESERCIIGGVLLDNDLLTEALESLEANDFYSPIYRRIFSAMIELYEVRKPIDPITIGEVLKREGSIDSVGGPTAITKMTFGLPHFTTLSEYIEIVQGKSVMRKLLRECNRISSAVMSEENTPEQTMLDAQTRINDLALASAVKDANETFIPLKQVIHHDVLPTLDYIEAGTSPKISTGFPGIDAAIGGGLSTSDVLLLAGLPASGKSALALQIAFKVAALGYPAAFLAGEMTNKENVFRIISQLAEITNLNSIKQFREGQKEFITQWCRAIEDVPLYLDHKTSDMQTLSARLRAIVKRHGIKLLVIDYIQLLKLSKADKLKRFERITEASQEVKRLANELEIAIISVAQFNREGAKSGKPTMHDLEGASQLEKDASLIFIIDRDELQKEKVEIRIVKGRNTGTGMIHGKFKGWCVSFEIDAPAEERAAA